MKFNYCLPFLTAPPNPAFTSGAAIGELARVAETAGFTSVALSDHPAPSEKWRQAGGHDALDPFVGLAFAAAATTQIRLFTDLVVVPYRHPLVLAKSVATLDTLSGGRLDLGLGAGYMRREFAAVGAQFEHRGELMDEAIELMKLAWTGAPIEHEGARFMAHGVTSQPTPLQQPHPPLWFGGNSRAALRRIARIGAGWSSMPSPRESAAGLKSRPLETIDDLDMLVAELRDECERVGRTEPIAVMYQIPHGDESAPIDALAESVTALAASGVTHVSVNGSGASLTDAVDGIARLGELIRGSRATSPGGTAQIQKDILASRVLGL